MPRARIQINQHKIQSKFPGLGINHEKLNDLLIEIMTPKLSCEEISLQKNFFSVAPFDVVLPNTLMALIDIEIMVVAYRERVEKQSIICRDIENFLLGKAKEIFSNKTNKKIVIKERIFKAELCFMKDMGFNQSKIKIKPIIIKPRKE